MNLPDFLTSRCKDPVRPAKWGKVWLVHHPEQICQVLRRPLSFGKGGELWYTDSYQHVHLATFWGFHPSGKRSVSRWNPDARSQHKDYRVTDPSSGESVIVSRSTAFRRKSENPSLQIEPCAPLLAGEEKYA